MSFGKLTFVFISNEIIINHTWKPLVEECIKRGHNTIFSTNGKTNGDVGFYCEDSSLPGNQKITIISINGLDQDHVVRPNYTNWFKNENWGFFDLGVTPGPRWSRGWLTSKKSIGITPRIGVGEIGWPKSDGLFSDGDPALKKLISPHLRRVLYAPQTEQDGKQTEVIVSLKDRNIALTIKHWETEELKSKYPDLLTDDYLNNLYKENEKAGKEDWVTLLDPNSNFIDALKNCDLLITDQSSVLYEAALCGIPTVTVKGWKHACGECAGPQPSPDICFASEPNMLGDSVEQIFSNYKYWCEKAIKIRDDNYVNLGIASSKMIDLAEDAFYGNISNIIYKNKKWKYAFYSPFALYFRMKIKIIRDLRILNILNIVFNKIKKVFYSF